MIPMNDPVIRVSPLIINFIQLALFLAAWLAREYHWFKERDAMLDRLMSRDLREYKTTVVKERVSPQSFSMLDDETLAVLEEKRKSEIIGGE